MKSLFIGKGHFIVHTNAKNMKENLLKDCQTELAALMNPGKTEKIYAYFADLLSVDYVTYVSECR